MFVSIKKVVVVRTSSSETKAIYIYIGHVTSRNLKNNIDEKKKEKIRCGHFLDQKG